MAKPIDSSADNCHICGSPALPRGPKALICTACASVSARVIPTEQELVEYYAVFNESYEGGGREAGRQKRVERYAQRYLSTVRRWRASGSLIDIGSSLNPFPSRASAAGYNVTVVDYIRPRTLPQHIEFIQATLDDPQMAATIGRTFQFVTAFAVIEHVRFPFYAAKNLADLCAPDGYLILMTPLLDAPLEKYAAGIPGWFRPPEHLHIFSRLGMTGLFEKIGLRPIHFERFEITWARQTARISIGAAEGIAGAVLSVLSKPTYERLRASRKTRCCEMGLYVFRHADRSH
jgi:SAM-dependent methyltransferase